MEFVYQMFNKVTLRKSQSQIYLRITFFTFTLFRRSDPISSLVKTGLLQVVHGPFN